MRQSIVLMLLVWTLASSAGAQTTDPAAPQTEQLTADPLELRAGDTVTASGEGCDPGNTVRFELRNPEPGPSVESTARADGSFTETIALPSTTQPGRTWLRATCLTTDSNERVMEAVLLVRRPQFLVTWTNVLFGVGTALLTAGIGLALVRPSDRLRSRGSKGSRRRSSSRRRRRSRSLSRSSRRTPEVEVAINEPSGAHLNGTKDTDPRTIEVE